MQVQQALESEEVQVAELYLLRSLRLPRLAAILAD
jgi:hypothetical protein